jgi:hypothetical protein
MFDPFCRTKRIKFYGVETTISQLNFVEWLISDGIYDYILTNRDKIQEDMELRLNCNTTADTKRQAISDFANKTIKTYNDRVHVKFD